jgi:hypothetical protein
VYFYAASADRPFMDPKALEALITTALVLLNAAVVVAFVAAYVGEAVSLRERWSRRGMRVLKVVADQREVTAALRAAVARRRRASGALLDAPEAEDGGAAAAGADDSTAHHALEGGAAVSAAPPLALEGGPGDGDGVADAKRDDGEGGDEDAATQWWYHPSGVAVRGPPQQIPSLDGASTTEKWMWCDANGSIVGMKGLPELLVAVDGVEALCVGDRYRWVHKTTRKLSELLAKPEDVGGAACCWEKGGGASGGADSPADVANAASGVVELRRSAPRETLNPVAGLAVGTDDATLAPSAAASSESAAVGGVQRFIGDVRMKIGVVRARRAAQQRHDGGDEAGITMQNRSAEL